MEQKHPQGENGRLFLVKRLNFCKFLGRWVDVIKQLVGLILQVGVVGLDERLVPFKAAQLPQIICSVVDVIEIQIEIFWEFGLSLRYAAKEVSEL